MRCWLGRAQRRQPWLREVTSYEHSLFEFDTFHARFGEHRLRLSLLTPL
jgi:hypothetical protein